VAAAESKTNWGMLEPLHQLLEPIFSIIRPFITSQVIIAVLFALLMYTWIAPPSSRGGVGLPGYGSPQRLAAYEDLWRREESDLWEWLEDRAGLDHLSTPGLTDQWKQKQKVLTAKGMGKKLDDERMSQRQIDDAIKVTEQRLSALKEAVARKKKEKATKDNT
jgi:hypothetical protein